MLTQNVSNKRREIPIIGPDPEVVAEVDPFWSVAVGEVDPVGSVAVEEDPVGSVAVEVDPVGLGSSRVHCGSGAAGS